VATGAAGGDTHLSDGSGDGIEPPLRDYGVIIEDRDIPLRVQGALTSRVIFRHRQTLVPPLGDVGVTVPDVSQGNIVREWFLGLRIPQV
jgi:hypothetical protein